MTGPGVSVSTCRMPKHGLATAVFVAGGNPGRGFHDSVNLALPLHSSFEVGALCGGLMGASPSRPCDDVGGSYAALSKLVGDPPNLLD